MTRSEQQRLIRELQSYAARMTREDADAFDMLRKREKDDEELDAVAIQKLETLHQRYVRMKSKADVEALWKKLTDPGKEK